MNQKQFIIILVLALFFIPFVNSLEITQINHNAVNDKAFITWYTSEPSDSKVYYSKDNSFSNVEASEIISISHAIVLSDLELSTSYNYYIESCNLDGCAQSPELSFNTAGSNPNLPDPSDPNLPDPDDPDPEESFPDTFFLQISKSGNEVPLFYNSRRIDLTVDTSKEAEVLVNVNGNLNRRKVYFGINRFTFRDIDLNVGLNEIEIISNFEDEQISENFTIEVDLTPPVINLQKSLDELLTDIYQEDSFKLEGSVSKFVFLDVYYSKNNADMELKQTFEIETGTFSYDLNLNDGDGLYNIKLVFEDIYGNQVNFETQTYLDLEENTISISTPNSVQSTSYVDRARIQGTTKPNSFVVVYVNNRNSSNLAWRSSIISQLKLGGSFPGLYYAISNEEGFFSIDVHLSKTYYVDEYDGQVFTPSTQGSNAFERSFTNVPSWMNSIRVVSTDISGREAIAELSITLSSCDYGGDWNIEIDSITPSKINPIYLKEGVASLSFNYKLTWQGPGQDAKIINDPVIRLNSEAQSSLRAEHEINDAINLASEIISGERLINQFNPSSKTGTVTIRLRPYDLDNVEFENTFNFLHALFNFEIDYQYEDPNYYGESNVLPRGRQIKCVNVEALIDDIDVNPFQIRWLANASRNAMVAVSEGLEPVHKFLAGAKKVNAYLAMGTNARYYYRLIQQRRACLPYAMQGFVPTYNENTTLPHECGDLENEDDKSKCNSCWDSIIKMEKAERDNRYVSDRLFCPSVPSVHEYVKRIGAGTRYYILNNPKESELSDTNDYSVKLDGEDIGIIVSKISFCHKYLNNFTGSDEEKQNWDKLCRLEYEFKWQSACLFSNEMYNKSFETKNMSGNVLNQVADVLDKFCFKKNAVEEDIFPVTNIETCIKACHPSVDDFIKKENGENEIDSRTGNCMPIDDLYKSENFNKLLFQGMREFTGVCYYMINPIGEEPGIYYGSVDVVNNCIRVPSTNQCKKDDQDRIHIDPIALRNVVKLRGFDGGEPISLTKKIEKSIDQNLNEQNKQEEYSKKLAEYGLGQFAFSHVNKYVEEPSRTIASSVKCGCISGLYEHISIYKTFVDLGAQCLSEVMYDPDTTATVCQKMFAMKLCDLLYESIKCFGKFYSQQVFFGNDKPEERTGIGGFMAAMDSAGAQVSNNLRDRYGNTAVFDTLFSEKAILNSMCMAAFFTDVDLEFDQLLSAADAMVVVDPHIMVAPRTREFMGEMAINGLSRYVYRFNTMMIAGADMNYHITLKCSVGMQSNGEPTDCMYVGQQKFYLQTGIQGFLRKREVLQRDFIKEISSDVRYDTVVVTYSYRNSKNELIEDKIEFPITEIGDKPPLHCQFDMLMMKFLCRFEIGSRGYATFGVPPKIKDTMTSSATLKIGQKVIVQGDIQKMDLEDDIKTVFLVYSVRDSSGNPIVNEKEIKITDTGLISLESLFQNEHIIVNDIWMNRNRDQSGYEVNNVIFTPSGNLNNEVKITISGIDQGNLKLHVFPTGESYYKEEGRNVTITSSGINYNAHGVLFYVKQGDSIIEFDVSQLPHFIQGQGYSAEITIGNEVSSKSFVLDLSLHYASENNPDAREIQPIFNEKEEKYSITFVVLNQDDSSKCEDFRFTKTGTLCVCNSEQCPNPNQPNNQYCYGNCREYPACSAVLNFNKHGLLNNLEDAKSNLSVKQSINCVCDPNTLANQADYTGNNDERYCYVVEDARGGILFKLEDEAQFVKDFNDKIIVRYDFARRMVIKDSSSGVSSSTSVQNAINELGLWDSGNLKDGHDDAKPLLNKYWAVVGDPNTDGLPWSAAFISFITSGELKSYAHSNYINEVFLNKNDKWRFVDPSQYNVQIGDIICKGRDGDNPTRHNMSSNHQYKSHCDIVVSINSNTIEYIGGNLDNSVKKLTLNLVNNKLPTPSDGNYFAILRRN